MNRDYLPLQDWMVHRPRIAVLLDKAMDYPLVSVVAPAGYGKTLALADYCRASLCRVVWVRLMRLDNDADRFWRTFAAAARREMPALADEMEKMAFPANGLEFDQFLRAFARQLYGGPGVILVLDNTENVRNPRVQQLCDSLAEAGLEGLCVVLVSNRRPVEHAVLGAGRHFHISARELAFDAEELDQLCRHYGLSPTAETLREAIAQTEGWPLALHLRVSDPTPPAPFGDVPRHQIIAELFERNHYAGYGGEVRRMLVRLSLFPQVSLGLVRALGMRDVTKMLDVLSLEIFVTYDYISQVFIFQTMYRDFLSQKQATLEAGETARLQAQGADWFLENGDCDEAMNLFWAVKDHTRFLDAVAAMPKRRARVESTDRILARLEDIPNRVRAKDDRVDFCRAFMYLNRAWFNRAADILQGLRRKLEDQPQPLPEDKQRLLGNIYLALSDIGFSQNTMQGLPYMKKAAALLPGGCSVRTEELYFVENNGVLYLPDNHPGRLPQMIRYFFEYARYADAVTNGSGRGLEFLFAAEAHFATGELDLAMEHAQKAVYKAQAARQHDIACNAIFMMMRVALYQGDGERARARCQEMEDYMANNRAPGLHTLLLCAQGWLQLRLKDEAGMALWLFRYEEGGQGMPLGMGRDRVLYADYQIVLQEYAAAYAVLVELEQAIAERGLWGVRVHLHITKAICLLNTDRAEKAMEAFWAAYNMTWQNGVYTPFAEYGKWMLDLLTAVRAQDRYRFDPAWREMLEAETLACARREAGMNKRNADRAGAAKMRGVDLTPREEEVLRYLGDGLSRNEISSLMDISVHGVKKHIANIYTKLGAVNRVDAVHIAMVNGLLEA